MFAIEFVRRINDGIFTFQMLTEKNEDTPDVSHGTSLADYKSDDKELAYGPEQLEDLASFV